MEPHDYAHKLFAISANVQRSISKPDAEHYAKHTNRNTHRYEEETRAKKKKELGNKSACFCALFTDTHVGEFRDKMQCQNAMEL